ncbi:MAG: MotA/TolQ/ExbB proton channel family protein, partial [Bacillota bacterium]
IRLLLLSGFLGSLIGLISMLALLSDPTTLGRNMSVSLLTLLYAVLFSFILLPIRAKIRAILHTLD